jgi:hypothetical protein
LLIIELNVKMSLISPPGLFLLLRSTEIKIS